MDLRQLRYFVQIIESGSLSKASRQLFIAQPALSQQMGRLEDEVGKSLLVRSSRGVIPTENGEALYHHAKFMLRLLDQAVSVARRDYADISGRVTLGLAPTTVCALGMPLLKHLRERHPGIVLNVVEGLSGHLDQMARMGQLDLAVLFSATAASELIVEPLLEEDLYVILPRINDFLPTGQDQVTLRQLSELPLLLPSPGHGLRRRIALEFDRANLSLDAVAEIDSLPLLMKCLLDGMGATIKPRAAIHALGDEPRQWCCIRISDADMTRPNYLYSMPPEKLSPAADVVARELRCLVQELVDSGAWEGVRLPEVGSDDSADPKLTAVDRS